MTVPNEHSFFFARAVQVALPIVLTSDRECGASGRSSQGDGANWRPGAEHGRPEVRLINSQRQAAQFCHVVKRKALRRWRNCAGCRRRGGVWAAVVLPLVSTAMEGVSVGGTLQSALGAADTPGMRTGSRGRLIWLLEE